MDAVTAPIPKSENNIVCKKSNVKLELCAVVRPLAAWTRHMWHPGQSSHFSACIRGPVTSLADTPPTPSDPDSPDWPS